MSEREDAIRRIKTVLQLTHTKSLTVTIPRYTAELVVSLLKEQEAVEPIPYHTVRRLDMKTRGDDEW